MKKHILFFFILFLAEIITHNNHALAQSFSVVQIDSSDYPRMKAKFYATGADGKGIYDIKPADFVIYEDGKARPIISVFCPQPDAIQPISAVLTIDISYSMVGKNMELAKLAARSFVELMPLENSDCAISSFDQYSYLNLDFSSNRQMILSAIDNLKPTGYTEYNPAFMAPKTGSLSIAKNGKHKKVVIFLTDGQSQGDEAKILAEAQANNITVYCITVGFAAPDVLKNVAAKTGGVCYENIKTNEEAQTIYKKILQQSTGGVPSEVVWEAGKTCAETQNIDINVPIKNLRSELPLRTPSAAIFPFTYKPKNIKFPKIPLRSYKDSSIVITAKGRDVIITAIESSSDYVKAPVKFPITILQGQSVKIPIRFTAIDSASAFAKLDIKDDGCNNVSIYTTGGYRLKRKNLVLQLSNPNGGETFYVGENQTISWKGLMPSETVDLELSTDAGKTWQPISVASKNLKYNWTIPNAPSAEALVRAKKVAQISKPEYFKWRTNISKETIENANIENAIFSPTGDRILVNAGALSNNALLIDAASGAIIHTFHEVDAGGAFSADGVSLFLMTAKGKQRLVKEYDAYTGKLFGTTDTISLPINEFVFTSDASTIIMADFGSSKIGKAAHLYIYDRKTKKVVKDFKAGHAGFIHSLQLSRNDKYLVSTGTNDGIIVWDWKKQDKVRDYSKLYFGAKPAISPDGRLLAAVDNRKEKSLPKIVLYDILNDRKMLEVNDSINTRSLSFNEDSDLLLAAGSQAINIFDVLTGETGYKNKIKSGFGAFNPDGTTFVSASLVSGDVALYEATIDSDNNSHVEDISDAIFTIVAPKAVATDIDMGQSLLTENRDSVVTFVRNTNAKGTVKVKDIRIVGGDSAFSIMSGFPPFDLAAGSDQNVEFRFLPKKAGDYQATLEVITATGTLKQTIRGKGVAKTFEIKQKLIDFGQVKVRTNKDSTVLMVLQNVSADTLRVANTLNIGENTPFEIVQGGGQFTLAPNESRSLSLRFSPKKVGRSSGKISFDIVGNSFPAAITLFGEGTATPLVVKLLAEGTAKDDTTRRNSLNDLVVEEFISKSMRPLLNYVFFDENNADIAPRYLKLLKEQTDGFTMNSLDNPETLPTYYHLLNIVGRRMRDIPTANVKLVGCNSDEGKEKKNIKLSEKRANTIKNYLMEVWNIEAKRISIEKRNLPTAASGNNTLEGKIENRRVEIIANDNRIIEPVVTDDTIKTTTPQIIYFKPTIQSEIPVAEWVLSVYESGKKVKEFKGEGNVPATIKWRINDDKESIPTSANALAYELYVRDQVEQTAVTPSLKVPIRFVTVADKRKNNIADKQIDRYSLILFDFNSSKLGANNAKIVMFVKGQIKSNSRTYVTGYTDGLGDSRYNQNLSTERAKATANSLKVPIAQTKGVGESDLLYSNEQPEGRFYCRTVTIVAETPIVP